MSRIALAADLRDAARRLRSSPGFTATILLIFAVGLGTTTAVFAIVHAQLLRPLPFAHPDRLVSLSETSPSEHNDRYEVSLPNLEDWRAADRDFEAMAYYVEDEVTVPSGDRALRLPSAEVSAEFFRTLGVAPEIGSAFRGGAGASGTVVVSHRFWRDRLAGRTDVVGRDLHAGGESRTIVGVMPASFDFPSENTDLWTPLVVEPWMRNRSVHVFRAIARLKEGVAATRANAHLSRVAAQVRQRDRGADPDHGAAVRSLREAIVGPVRSGLWALAGAVLLVWLIACADLASMLLTRAARRKREIAIRRALGASRWRLAAAMATEGTLIGGLGGTAAYFAFVWSARAVSSLLPPGLPHGPVVSGGPAALSFSLAVGLASGVVLAIAPAILLLRHGRLLPGRDADTARPERSLVDVLVITQTALCMVLMTGAALLGRSFLRLASVDPGFREERLLTMKLDLGDAGWRTRSELRAFASELERRTGTVPGIVSASATSRLPVSGGDSQGDLTVEGRSVSGAPPPASFRRILPGYFRTMGIPIVRGRDFDGRDAGTPMVAIVNASLAARCWPGMDPLGRRIKVGPAEREPWLTVVGVVGDVLNGGLADGVRLATYEPFTQRPTETLSLVARVDRGSEASVAAVVRAVRAVDPRIAVYDVAWMKERIRQVLAPRRTYTVATGFFAGATLLLAALGLFGLLSSAVNARTREIGVRVAVGARAADIRGLVLRWGGRRLAAGIAVGAPASAAAAEVLARRVPGSLFGISPSDGATFASVTGLLALVGLAAALVPARRAARIDPMEALRTE
ncbi:MAG TPA: ABC transporter permease [Thermoanaerobaculia bacterium]|nr:ABC transporter permease [Thermoanaerobaculia bacterium]